MKQSLFYDTDIIGNEEVQQFIEATVNKKILSNHPYQITEMPDGRWQTYVKDKDGGKRKLIREKTQEDLNKKLIAYYKGLSSQAHIDNKTVDDMYHEWLVEYKIPRTESQNTIKRHEQHYKKYLEGTELFKTPIKKVTKLELETFCNRLVKDYNLSSKEYTNVKTIIKGLFEYAFDKEYIEKNPMDRVKIGVKFRQVAKKSGKTQTFTSEEHEALNKYLDEYYTNTQDLSYLAVKVNFFLGLRIGELCALKWKDIVDENHLHIEREEVRNQETREVSVVPHTKTNTDRNVLIIPKAYEIFETIKENKNANTDSESYIFLRDGERLRARQIEYVLDKYSERMDIQNKSSHKIRKTYASYLSAANVPIDEVRGQLGHQNLSTTLGYIYNPLTEKETLERIERAL